jgi:meckelin
MPWLFYTDSASVILSDDGIPTLFTIPNYQMTFRLDAYSVNGSFLGYYNVTNGVLQLCKNTQGYMNAAYTFGVTYEQTCQLTADDFWNEMKYPAVLYDMWLEYVQDGATKLYAIPILVKNYVDASGSEVNTGTDRTKWKLVRRFFMVDRISGKTSPDTPAVYARYAKSITIHIELQPTAGRIYPPYVEIVYDYASYTDAVNTLAQLTFQVVYTMSYSDIHTGISIAVGVLSGVAVLYGILCIWSWFRRSGRIAIDATTIIKFVLFSLGSVGDAIFVVILGASIWWEFFFKLQGTVVVVTEPTNTQYITLLAIAFSFKFLDVIHLIVTQSTVDVFLIDWEHPDNKPSALDTPGQKTGKAAAGSSSVSIWRTYFAANEWNEIQTTRKINSVFQIFCSVFFLSVIGFGNWGTMDPFQHYQLDNPNQYYAPMSPLFRFAMIGLVYIITALCQWLYFTLFYERFIEHPIQQFIDLCAMGNVSVLLLESTISGYYIHGRSPHGKADTGLRQMHVNLAREQQDLCGQRGLEPGSELQTFRIVLPRKLRNQYDRILMPVLMMQNGAASAAGALPRGADTGAGGSSIKLEPKIEASIDAYGALNKLLQSYIEHSSKYGDYIVRDRKLLEQILDVEFEEQSEMGFFYRDPRQSFQKLLYYGHELSLLVFEILFFGLMDLAMQNYLFDGAILYLLMEIFVRMTRQAAGRMNLAKKTLVDKRFLI